MKLERIDIASSIADDPHNALTLASVIAERDAAVLVSHSRTTTGVLEVLEVATEAARRGSAVIAITGHRGTALSRPPTTSCSASLAPSSDLRPAAMDSRMSQLAIVDTRFIVVAQRSDDPSRPLLGRSRAAVRRHHRF